MLNATCPTTNTLRKRRRSGPPRASALSAETTSAFDSESAGASPESTAAINERPSVKASARASSETVTPTGSGSVGSSDTSNVVIRRAIARPAAPPRRKSSIDSTSICRISRPRPAPIARRTAISLRRALARASNTPATFAHAIASTSPTSPMSTARNAATGAPLPGIGDDATTRRPLPRFSAGNSCSSARPIFSSSALAWRTLTPGFKRAPITSHTNSRPFRSDTEPRGDSSPTMLIGTHRSPVSTVVPRNSGGATPITVKGRPFNCNVWPTTAGSPLKRRIQN